MPACTSHNYYLHFMSVKTRGSEKQSDLPRVTWRVSGAGRIGTQGRARNTPFPFAVQEPLCDP